MLAIGSRLAALFVLTVAATPLSASDVPVHPGKALYEARCASCHANPGATKAPSFDALKQMSMSRVFFAMSNGTMKTQAAGLTFPEIGMLASYASAGDQAAYAPAADAMCKTRDVDTTPVVAGWAFDASSSRALGAAQTSVDATNVGKLELAWAFGLPGTTETRSQPVATPDTLFVGASSGHVFALDRMSGCIKWHAATPLRNSLTLGRVRRGCRTLLRRCAGLCHGAQRRRRQAHLARARRSLRWSIDVERRDRADRPDADRADLVRRSCARGESDARMLQDARRCACTRCGERQGVVDDTSRARRRTDDEELRRAYSNGDRRVCRSGARRPSTRNGASSTSAPVRTTPLRRPR